MSKFRKHIFGQAGSLKHHSRKKNNREEEVVEREEEGEEDWKKKYTRCNLAHRERSSHRRRGYYICHCKSELLSRCYKFDYTGTDR
ncbi:MAG: hypothetical protein PHV63_04050 [Candidatus Daviesbacteria bacterium]|nr:hypothetical protein [Candidatus Daviesbacteria bacterium]